MRKGKLYSIEYGLDDYMDSLLSNDDLILIDGIDKIIKQMIYNVQNGADPAIEINYAILYIESTLDYEFNDIEFNNIALMLIQLLYKITE